MLLTLSQVLSPAALQRSRQLLADADWQDGRMTAGVQSALVKNNQQLPESAPQLPALRQLMLDAVRSHDLLFTAALPKAIFPPLFNCYGGSHNAFGDHIDNGVRRVPGGTGMLRTDLSITVFISEPEEYEGGELVIQTPGGLADERIKLRAGDAVLYPATTVHRVEPVTAGQRLASFFWIESMIREGSRRQLLFDLDMNLLSLRQRLGDTDSEVIGLTGVYHNLLRQWVDV